MGKEDQPRAFISPLSFEAARDLLKPTHHPLRKALILGATLTALAYAKDERIREQINRFAWALPQRILDSLDQGNIRSFSMNFPNNEAASKLIGNLLKAPKKKRRFVLKEDLSLPVIGIDEVPSRIPGLFIQVERVFDLGEHPDRFSRVIHTSRRLVGENHLRTTRRYKLISTS